MRIQTGLPAPARWTRAPAKYLFSLQNRPISDDDEIVTAFRDGVVTQRRNRRVDGFTNSLKEIGYHGVRAGDLVIHGMDGFAGAIGVSDSDGKLSPVAHCHLPGAGVDPRFYSYLLRTLSSAGRIASLARGIRERSTAFDSTTFGSLRVPVPTYAEQRRIADFLDAETARIDALITAKQQMLDLGAVRHRRWVSEIMGMPQGAYLGEGRCPLRYVAHVSGGITLGKTYKGELARYPYIRVANVQDGFLNLSEVATIEVPEQEVERFALVVGDLLVLEGNGNPENLGRGCIWRGEVPGTVLHQNHVHVVRPSGRLLPEFLDLALRTEAAREYFTGGVNQVSIASLSQERLSGLRVPVPSVGDQQAIVDRVQRENEHVKRMASTLTRQIELLRERRQALITAAVTGELAV